MADDSRSLETVSRLLTTAYDEDYHASIDGELTRLMIQLSHVDSAAPEPPASIPVSPEPQSPRRRRWLRLRRS